MAQKSTSRRLPNKTLTDTGGEAGLEIAGEPKGLALFAQRFLVHAFGLLLGDFLTGSSHDPSMTMAQTWIGCICLVPRGNFRRPEWFIPFGSGLLQLIVAFGLGYPLAFAILLGGCQSWIQRIGRRNQRTWADWVVLPALFGCVTSLQFEVAPMGLASSFVLIFAASFLAHFIYKRVRAEHVHGANLKESLAKLSALLPSLSQEQLISPAKLLLANGEKLQKVLQGAVRPGYEAIERLAQTVEHMVSFIEASKPSTSSGWSKGLLRSENWGRKGDAALNDLVKEVQETNTFLQGVLKEFRQAHKGDLSELEKKWQAFEDSASELIGKASSLPAGLSETVQSIAGTSLEIVKSMREDPADRAPGERFLDRYLSAVHKIIDEYIRLASGPMQKDVEQAMQRSAEVLERMDSAFKDELSSLMQNDAINFSAEVDAIDAMLKMKGH